MNHDGDTQDNLRIHFLDTSSSASFPKNDWRIVINDADNGGNEYFAIEDATAERKPFLVEAGARDFSLYVAANGYIGIGTQDPRAELHSIDGDTPTLRLEQDGSSGFTPQAWDISGNESNFFIRDTTNGSKLPFKIQPGAATNTLYVASSSKIGLGTTQPQEKLHVKDDDNPPKIRLDGPDDPKTDCDIDCSLVNWRRAGVTDVVQGGSSTISVEFTEELPDANYVVSLTAVGSMPGKIVKLVENSLTNNGFDVYTENSPSAVVWVTHPIIDG